MKNSKLLIPVIFAITISVSCKKQTDDKVIKPFISVEQTIDDYLSQRVDTKDGLISFNSYLPGWASKEVKKNTIKS